MACKKCGKPIEKKIFRVWLSVGEYDLDHLSKGGHKQETIDLCADCCKDVSSVGVVLKDNLGVEIKI